MKKLFFGLILLLVVFTSCKKTSVTDNLTTTKTTPTAAFKINNPFSINTDGSVNVLEANILDIQNNSTNATTYIWDFGYGGNILTDKVPNYFYNTCSRTLTITLTAKDQYGQTATYSQPYTVVCCRGFNPMGTVLPTHYHSF